jgi:anti-anti-sigma factor
MTLETTITGDITVVLIPQRLDAGTAQAAESDLRAILARSPGKMILDFSGTDYVASAGLRVLLVITRDTMRAGGKVILAGIRPAVLKVFEMAGFTSIFSICASREEAVQKMK